MIRQTSLIYECGRLVSAAKGLGMGRFRHDCFLGMIVTKKEDEACHKSGEAVEGFCWKM